MDEDVAIETINKVLFRLKTDYESQTTTVKKQLIKVCNAIEKMAVDFEEHKKGLKASKINVSNVSRESGVSRKTFYNNEILKKYVEQCSQQTEADGSLDEATAEKYLEQIHELKERINAFLSDTAIDAENLRCDYDELLDKMQILQQQYNNLQELYEKCEAERNKAVKELNEINSSKLWN